ncbi:hypothetical protein J5W01_03110 [Akkermansia muciniphila]|nr:hypothetical protein [Candidatus Akkermansia timonensis]MBT9561943.1 hypothetical protein [Candidatus Akkermansia timonensis]MBT9600201.1 hypothetical protein [Akkermansia muciniphila]
MAARQGPHQVAQNSKIYTLSFSHFFTGSPWSHTSGIPSRNISGKASPAAAVLSSFFSEEPAIEGIPAVIAKTAEQPKTSRLKFNMVKPYSRNQPRQDYRRGFPVGWQNKIHFSPRQENSCGAGVLEKRKNAKYELFPLRAENVNSPHPHFFEFHWF